MPLFLIPFIYYSIILTTLVGVLSISIFNFDFGRLIGISENVKNMVMWHVFYSLSIILVAVVLATFICRSREVRYRQIFLYANPSQYLFLRNILIWANLLYLIFLVVKNWQNLPLFILFSNQDISAALAQAKNEHLIGGYAIPYISKFFDFSNYFVPLLCFLVYLKTSKGLIIFIISLLCAFIYLSLDLQKAPFLLLCLMLFFLYSTVARFRYWGVLFFLFIFTLFLWGRHLLR